VCVRLKSQAAWKTKVENNSFAVLVRSRMNE
jgi:hypothetical protein